MSFGPTLQSTQTVQQLSNGQWVGSYRRNEFTLQRVFATKREAALYTGRLWLDDCEKPAGQDDAA